MFDKETTKIIVTTLVSAFLNMAVSIGAQHATAWLVEQLFPGFPEIVKRGIAVGAGISASLLSAKTISKLVYKAYDGAFTIEEIEGWIEGQFVD